MANNKTTPSRPRSTELSPGSNTRTGSSAADIKQSFLDNLFCGLGRLPFAAYLEELGERPVEERDVTVAEVVAFVCEHRQRVPEEV